MKRILLILLILAGWITACAPSPPAVPIASQPRATVIKVFRSPTCGCCGDWISYIEKHGYTAQVEEVQDAAAIKSQHNIPPRLQSCHTAVVDGYVLEGHVPVADIERLLAERPQIAGLAVPGMPAGAPGMETPGVEPQPYDVLAFDQTGSTQVFSSYNQ